MPSFWDLLPASAWPTQPFIPPFDPTQPSPWPPVAPPQWNAASPSALAGLMPPAASANAPLLGPSVSPWDSAMREALAAQADASRASTVPDAAGSDALAAVSGNPNIARQGARIRAAAAARPAPPQWVADIGPEADQAGADALHAIDAAFNPYSAEATAAREQSAQAESPGDALAAAWEDQKRLGRGILGFPGYLFAPITGATRSAIGHPLADLEHFGGTLIAPGIAAKDDPARLYADAKNVVDQAMWALGPRGGMPRAPLRPALPALPRPPGAAAPWLAQTPPLRAPSLPPADAGRSLVARTGGETAPRLEARAPQPPPYIPPLPLSELLRPPALRLPPLADPLYNPAIPLPPSRSVSTYRYSGPGETFYHYGYAADEPRFARGLRPGGFATSNKTLSGPDAQALLALPHDTVPDALYRVVPNQGTLLRVNPVIEPTSHGPGGETEFEFPRGTGPGTVSLAKRLGKIGRK